MFRYNPPSVGFADLSATALAMNAPGGVVPSATIGSVIAVATGKGSGSGSGSSPNSAPAQAASLISRSGILTVGLALLSWVL